MRTTTTLNRLTEKPLNAKYYAFDGDTPEVHVIKKTSFFMELAQFFVDVMSLISKPYHRL
jgi:hypothetical protein